MSRQHLYLPTGKHQSGSQAGASPFHLGQLASSLMGTQEHHVRWLTWQHAIRRARVTAHAVAH